MVEMVLDFIFCVLCYGSTEDLERYFRNVKKVRGAYKVIVIDSYYSDEIRSKMHAVAEANDADFIPVPNKGYGAGNNAGIRYALKNYQFRFLAVTNPDIDFLGFDIGVLDHLDNCVIGPSIVTVEGKRQNPYRPFALGGSIELMEYWGYKNNSKFWLYAGLSCNKILREMFAFWHEQITGKGRTYSVHGSCIILGKNALDALMEGDTLFDERIFMFSEEMDIARRARLRGVKMYYIPKLKIRHFEDGSINLAKMFDEASEERKSYLYCYEKWSNRN